MAADPKLDGPTFGPARGGAPDSLVVLLHGWGADGNDLIGLAPPLSQRLPGALFLSPNGPEPCDANPMGRQWFALTDRGPAQMRAGADAVAPAIDAFIDDALAAHGLEDDRLALVGFSQGTMMALHVALRRPRPCAALVGYSGMLIAPESLAAEIRSRPPILLVHGEVDPVVPVQAMAAAADALAGAGLAVEWHRRPGLAHGIDEFGMRAGAEFVASALNPSRASAG